MKKIKLSLDKINVVRLNTTSQILGGAKYEPTGKGVPHSTHCPDPTPNIDYRKLITTSVVQNTNRPAPRSGLDCRD